VFGGFGFFGGWDVRLVGLEYFRLWDMRRRVLVG